MSNRTPEPGDMGRFRGWREPCLNCGMAQPECESLSDDPGGPFCCHECDHSGWVLVTIAYEAGRRQMREALKWAAMNIVEEPDAGEWFDAVLDAAMNGDNDE